MRTIPGRWMNIFVLFCIAIFGFASAVSAQGPASTPRTLAGESATSGTATPFVAPKFTIGPVGKYKNNWFEVTADPGSRLELTAGIKNYGAAPVTLSTFATNAINPANGGFTAGEADDKLTGPTLWLDYSDQLITLSPNEEHDLRFSVSVPADTPPGLYVTALVAQTSESLEIPGTKILRQYIRSAVSVEITVPGRMTSGFSLGAPTFYRTGSLVQLDVPIKNTGTARLRPEGTLTITTPDGQKVATSPIKMGSIYRGYETTVRASLPSQTPDGTYLITLGLKDSATGKTASIKDVQTTLAEPTKAAEPPPFVVDSISVNSNGHPVQYADVAATVTNNGQNIPTADVTLVVKRDGQEVEQYPLAQNQALPQGQTKIAQRYIPKDGWTSGTWTFQIVVSAVNVGSGTQTVLATVDAPGAIAIP